jgi:hypothetical protein
MDISTVLFLILRPAHVLLAAVWIGSTIFMSYLLMPAIDADPPTGGRVMMTLNRNGLVTFFGAIGGVTVLTGLYLYWRFTGGFDPEVSRSHAGMAFGIGGLAGILAAVIGGSVVGRTSKQLMSIMEQAARLPDGPEKGTLLKPAAALRQRMASAGHIVVALQVVALVLMAVAHYI